MLQQICYIRVVMINKGDVMNSISKTILLSAVSLFVDNGNLTYASEQIPLSVPKSGIQTLHTHHTYLRHTLQRLDLSSRLFDDLMISGEEQKVAKVCFITDAGNCSGDKFGNLETPDGGGGIPDDHGTPEELCEDVGYSLTGDCPALQTPHEKCPYDSSYYDKCVCQSDLVSCPSPKVGVGTSCDGKYQSCCTPLSDESGCQYGTTTSSDGCGGTRTVCKACTPLTNETNCRYGYVLGSDGCGGTRNVCKNCTPLTNETNCRYGYVLGSDGCGGTRNVCKDCTPISNQTNCQYGTQTVDNGCGGTATICKDCTPLSDETNCQYGTTTGSNGCGGTRTVCKDCTPLSDETNCQYGTTTGSNGCGGTRTVCNCPSYYKYTCTGNHEQPLGESCGNKYQLCGCDDKEYKFNGQICCNLCIGYSYTQDQLKILQQHGTCQEYESCTGCNGTLYKCTDMPSGGSSSGGSSSNNDLGEAICSYSACYLGDSGDSQYPIGVLYDASCSCIIGTTSWNETHIKVKCSQHEVCAEKLTEDYCQAQTLDVHTGRCPAE